MPLQSFAETFERAKQKRPGGGGEKHPPNNQEVNQEDNHSLSPDKSDAKTCAAKARKPCTGGYMVAT